MLVESQKSVENLKNVRDFGFTVKPFLLTRFYYLSVQNK